MDAIKLSVAMIFLLCLSCYLAYLQAQANDELFNTLVNYEMPDENNGSPVWSIQPYDEPTSPIIVDIV